MKILVLEDQTTYFRAIETALLKHEFSIERARTVQDALAALHASNRPDGIIIDIQIDGEIDRDTAGLRFAKQVMDDYPVPFIFLTQYYDKPEISNKITELGLDLSLLFNKSALDNENAFVAALVRAFERFPVEQKKVESGKIRIDWKLGFYLNEEDGEGQFHQFLGKDEILFFTGDGAGGVLIYTTKQKEPFKFSRHLGHLIPLLEAKWPNFIKLGAGFYVNLEKISKLVRNNNGTGVLLLRDDASDEEREINIPAAGVATLHTLGIIIRTR